MVGLNWEKVFCEVEPYLSDAEQEEIAEQRRQEAFGNIPNHDYLTELYSAFRDISKDCLAEHVEAIGILTAMRENEDRADVLDIIVRQVREGTKAAEESRKEIIRARETIGEFKGISG